jgi:pseudouridine-5'-phosphate glycosidase
MSDLLDVRPEVAEAIAAGSAVVALESTVISHGLPHPHNLETALAMESAIRERGATPATIGLLAGRAVIGLSEDEIGTMATAEGITKVSRRDLAAVLSRGGLGATTVAATICLAARAGISMMGTGGLGGVHRGGEDSLDVSADLYELARVPVGVVCAGAKSILDLPRTLEVLESLGVPVVGYRTGKFPAFYSRETAYDTSTRVESAEEAAHLLGAQRALGLESGTLFVQPPPAEHALPFSEVESWIEQANAEATEAGVTGSAVTPFLLQRVTHLSEGRTLAANVALLVQNAELAAEIAGAGSDANAT